MLAETLPGGVKIRLIDLHESPAFFAMLERDRAFFQPWIPFLPSVKSPEDARAKIARYKRMYGEGEAYFWSLWAEGRMVGLVLLMHIDEASAQAELGYMVASEFCGKGLATAACRRILDFAFGELGLGRISLSCDPRNAASIALARKLGFELEGRLRSNARIDGQVCDTALYGLLREEAVEGGG